MIKWQQNINLLPVQNSQTVALAGNMCTTGRCIVCIRKTCCGCLLVKETHVIYILHLVVLGGCEGYKCEIRHKYLDANNQHLVAVCACVYVVGDTPLVSSIIVEQAPISGAVKLVFVHTPLLLFTCKFLFISE